MRPCIECALAETLQPHVLHASRNPAGKVALRQFEKYMDSPGVDQGAVNLSPACGVREEFHNRCYAEGFFLFPG